MTKISNYSSIKYGVLVQNIRNKIKKTIVFSHSKYHLVVVLKNAILTLIFHFNLDSARIRNQFVINSGNHQKKTKQKRYSDKNSSENSMVIALRKREPLKVLLPSRIYFYQEISKIYVYICPIYMCV